MIIRRKAEGKTVDITNVGTVITFGGELSVDINLCAGRFPVSLDICADESGRLVLGLGETYVAQIDIPAKTRKILVGEPDDYDFCVLKEELSDVKMEEVVVTLWPR